MWTGFLWQFGGFQGGSLPYKEKVSGLPRLSHLFSKALEVNSSKTSIIPFSFFLYHVFSSGITRLVHLDPPSTTWSSAKVDKNISPSTWSTFGMQFYFIFPILTILQSFVGFDKFYWKFGTCFENLMFNLFLIFVKCFRTLGQQIF